MSSVKFPGLSERMRGILENSSLMLPGLFLWECFQRDVIGAKRYPSVLRRLFIDIPVKKGRRIILRVPFWVYKRLNLEALWKKVQRSPPVSLNA